MRSRNERRRHIRLGRTDWQWMTSAFISFGTGLELTRSPSLSVSLQISQPVSLPPPPRVLAVCIRLLSHASGHTSFLPLLPISIRNSNFWVFDVAAGKGKLKSTSRCSRIYLLKWRSRRCPSPKAARSAKRTQPPCLRATRFVNESRAFGV